MQIINPTVEENQNIHTTTSEKPEQIINLRTSQKHAYGQKSVRELNLNILLCILLIGKIFASSKITMSVNASEQNIQFCLKMPRMVLR